VVKCKEQTLEKDHRPDIDGLRAVAVVLVVLFHAFPGVVPGGFVGVDVFFVISGYLISGNILSRVETKSFTLSDFYVRRARRILPALALTIAATLAAGWLLLAPPAYGTLGLHALAGTLFFPNFIFWHEVGYFDAAAETKPLLHLWSLGIEEQFYLLWPLLLMLLGRRPKILVQSLCIIVAASLAYSCYATFRSPAAAFYSPISRLWELGAGGILFIMVRHPSRNDILSSLGVVLIAASAFLLKKTSPFPGLAAVPPVAGAVLIIASGSRILERRLPELLGRISYPLYLWHWPLLSFATTNGMDSPQQRMALVIVSLLLSTLTYQLIEKPIRFGGLRTIGVVASCTAMVSLAGFSGFVFLTRGIPERLPPDVMAALDLTRYEPETDARYPACWLDAMAPFESYARECRTGTTLIWGDSHAARLYSGFKGTGIDVAQFTRNGCMPSLDTKLQSTCDASNADIIAEVERLKPRRVILFAAWLNHGTNWQVNDDRAETIERAVARLKRTVDDVLVIGPAPVWTPDLPSEVFRFWSTNRRLPDRMKPVARPYHDVDVALAATVKPHGARFISLYDALCDPNGCITHTPTSRSDLLSWDYGHFTTSGARSVVQLLQLNIE
jgi:peptidoglycan/LPS O-acetylase OafA/YrhL